MSIWLSYIDQPYVPFSQRQETIPAYYWCVVDDFDIVHQKSTELFFTDQNAMKHYHNTQMTVSPFFTPFSIKSKKKTMTLDIKLLIKYLILFLYQKQLKIIKKEKCQSCESSDLSQLSHYNCCLLEDEIAINLIDQIHLNRKEICKHAWSIKKLLRLELTQLEIENTIDCFQSYVPKEQIKDILKSTTLPIMYQYLFNEIIT